MDKFINTCYLPKLNKEDTSNLNTNNVTKTVILNMPPKKKSFEFYQNFTEVLTLIFLKLFYKIEGEAHYQLKNIKSVFP